MTEMIFELSDAELDTVAAGGVPHGNAYGYHAKFDVDVAVVAQNQEATVTQNINIKNTHGPLETGPGDLYIYNSSDITQTQTGTARA